MDTMLAGVFEKAGSFVLKQVPIPKLQKDDEIIVEVEAVSICGTDVHITADPPGYIATDNTILGHEICGTIVEKGSRVSHLEIGDRIVVNPNNYCGNCCYCRKNLPNQCEHIEALGIDYDGGFAKFVRINSKVAYRISKDVCVEVASCTEPLACAVNGLNKVKVSPSDSAVVIGSGPIGLMIAMLLQASGVTRLYILETSEYRNEFAKNLHLGTVLNPLKDNINEIVYADTGIGADFVFDVTGSQLATAIDLVRKDGSVVLFGVNKRAISEIRQCEITTKEIRVLGTWLANATFPKAIQILESGCIDINALITDVIPLSEVKAGIEKLAKGQAVKVIVKP